MAKTGENPENSKKYCFAVSPAEADNNGDGKVGKTIPKNELDFKCYNFHFNPPTFYGPNIGECNPTPTSFEVSFDKITEGTFDNARIYYKELRRPGDIGYLGEEDDRCLINDGSEVDYGCAEAETVNVGTDDLGIGSDPKNPWYRILLDQELSN